MTRLLEGPDMKSLPFYRTSTNRCVMGMLLFLSGVFVLSNSSIARGSADAALPKAEAVFDRFIEVTGGKAAYEKLKNRVITATLEMPAMNLKMKMTSYQAGSPDRMYVLTEVPNMGSNEQGFNGEVAWDKSAMMGARIKEGGERAMFMRQATFNPELNWKKLYKEMKTLGIEDVEGKPAIKVEMTSHDGKTDVSFYDKESGLLVKLLTTFSGPAGDMQVESMVTDYKVVDGLKLAHKMKQKIGMQEVVSVFEKIEHNVDIPANKFDLPAEIKELLSKKGGAKPEETKKESAPATGDKKGP
jgi:hypothetical protein